MMPIDLPGSRGGRPVWLAHADDLDTAASDCPRRNWPHRYKGGVNEYLRGEYLP
jgi:hypothetical protein